ncbi:uncharacterized protein LOC143244422 isoform X2 [Tachypleus tridentatus]
MGLFLRNSNYGSGFNPSPSFRNLGNNFPNFSFRPHFFNTSPNKHRINSWSTNYGHDTPNTGRGRVNHGNHRSRNRQFLPSHLQQHEPQQRWKSTHTHVGRQNFGKRKFDSGHVGKRNGYGQFNRETNLYSSFNVDNKFNRRDEQGFNNGKTDRSSFPYGTNTRNAFNTKPNGPNSRSFNIKNSFQKGSTYGHDKASGWSNSYSTSWESGKDGSKFSGDFKKQFDEVFKSFR